MSPASVAPLLTVLLFACMGWVVYHHNRSGAVNRVYGLWCLNTIYWQFSWVLLFNTTSEHVASVLVKIGYTGIIFLPINFTNLVASFLGYKNFKRIVFGSYLIGLLFAVSVWIPGLFLSGFYKYSWGFYPKAGILHPLYLAFLTLLVAHGHYLLYRHLKNPSLQSQERNQTLFFLVSYGMYSLASVDFITNYGVPIYPYGFLFTILSLTLVGFAILKHRLMDIELLARGALTRAFSLCLIAFPLLIGRMLVLHLIAIHEPMFAARIIGTLGLSVMSFSLGILFLRFYDDPCSRALSTFFVTVSLWNACELVLDVQQTGLSVFLFRGAYALGCTALLSWFSFWQAYFNQPRSLKWLRWSAYAMMLFSVCTPFVLKTLQFDPLGISPAIEIPGRGLFFYGGWFILAIAATGIWIVRNFKQAAEEIMQSSRIWVYNSFTLGTLAMCAYFAYVTHWLRFPLYPFLGMGLCLIMARNLLNRIENRFVVTENISLAVGATSLMYPLVAGGMMTQGAWLQVSAGILLVLSVPQVLQEVESSIQIWVDQTLFRGLLSGRQAIKDSRKQVFRLSNLKDLVEESALYAQQMFHADRVVLYFHDLTSNQYRAITQVPHHTQDELPSFGESDPLIVDLQKAAPVSMAFPNRFEGFSSVMPLHHDAGLFGFLLVDQKTLDLPLIEEVRLSLQSALSYANVFYEQSMKIDKLTHDNIRYAGNIRRATEMSVRFSGTASTEKQKEWLAIIDQNAALLEEYLNDLREDMSITARRVQGKYKMEIYDLLKVIRKLMPAEHLRAEHKGITLTCNLDHVALPRTDYFQGWGEPQSVRHVIENLLSNAFKFTPSGGTVHVEAKNLGDYLEIAVSDTGPGIPKESLAHIFDLFFQGKGRESMEKSTGLGLSIVKEIVALHQGNIDVISNEGQGTTFFVRLPSASHQVAKAA